MQTANPEFIGVIKQLQSWHESQVAQLKLITENRTAELKLGDLTVAADSDIAKGIRFGVLIALDRLGKLPFSVTPCEIEEEVEEYDDQALMHEVIAEQEAIATQQLALERGTLLAETERKQQLQAQVDAQLALTGGLYMLLAACNRIDESAGTFEAADGLTMGVSIDDWNEFTGALTLVRKTFAAHHKDALA